jgi:hypothetical protein
MKPADWLREVPQLVAAIAQLAERFGLWPVLVGCALLLAAVAVPRYWPKDRKPDRRGERWPEQHKNALRGMTAAELSENVGELARRFGRSERAVRQKWAELHRRRRRRK